MKIEKVSILFFAVLFLTPIPGSVFAEELAQQAVANAQIEEKPTPKLVESESLMATPIFSDINRERIFPKGSKPADKVWIFNVGDMSAEEKILITTIQGIVNQDKPQLFLYSTVEDTTFSTARGWIDWLVEKKYIKSIGQIKSVEDLFKKWNIKQVIQVDPELSASLNVATMMAAFEKLPVAYPQVAAKYGLEVKIDLKDRWPTNISAYQWAYDEYWDRMNHDVVAWFASLKEYSQLRDYLISQKIFTFWVTGPKDGNPENSNTQAEIQFVQELLTKKIPTMIPVIGFPWASNEEGISEVDGVKLISRAGKFHICNNWRPNLSVWSGLDAKKKKYKQKPARKLKLQNDKVYVSFIVSDGDNQNTWFNWFPDYWKNPLHGELPIGWGMGPGIVELQGPLVDFYFDDIKPLDSFGCSVSGVGYIFPDYFARDFKPEYRDQLWQQFSTLTDRYMDKLDMNWLHIFRKVPINQTPLYRYTSMKAVDTIYCDYWGSSNYEDAHYPLNGKPVFHAIKNDGGTLGLIDDIMMQVPEEKPAFFYIFIMNWRYSLDDIQELTEKWPDYFEYVRPDEMGQLYKQWVKKQNDSAKNK